MGISGLALGKSGYANKDWWPDQLDVGILHQHGGKASPMADDFDYAKAFESLDLAEVKKDIEKVLTTSVDWWPADFGHYGPFMIRMAWHAAGTYRTADGRGGSGSGMLRFAPLNSWPDNANLDKARRLIWPVKQKYGSKLSWGDLMILTGNVAIESMGLPTFGFGGGRVDRWEPDDGIYWGPEQEWLADKRYDGKEPGKRMLETPLGAVQMGLIYVNPQGSNGRHDPKESAHDIRETFGRMAMNDYETVALVAGGHTFGKSHAAAEPAMHVGPEPESAAIADQGFGWRNSFESGRGAHTITSEMEGVWTSKPTQWDNDYLDKLFKYDWQQTRSPAGAVQWEPVGDVDESDLVPDAHDPSKKHKPMMFTTDLSLKEDPSYKEISRHFQQNPEEFGQAFAKAWYKLTHRDMGPHERLLGPEVPEPQLWQDPVPAVEGELVNDEDVKQLKAKLLDSGLTTAQLVSTAWAAASSFRGTDKRGGANGGRIRLEPQKSWTINQPDELAKVLPVLEKVADDWNASSDRKISFADTVVLGGCAGVESAAKQGGVDVTVPFRPGRTDASQEHTDVDSFNVLEITADGFRNYISSDHTKPAHELLIDRAHLLNLTAPEMTALVGGLRVLGTNVGHPTLGLFTERPGTLSNDFFVNLLDMQYEWGVSTMCDHFYEGKHRETGETKWMGTSVDLLFGSNSILRALAEVYASDDAGEMFIHDFITAWNKVMELDRFDR
ncbi:MAG: catalase/peroxidase HPI [Planctomycetota bacterium]